MPNSLGCDIVFIPRLTAALARTPTLAQKTFTPTERKATSPQSLAGIWAAKEAMIKALGLTLRDMSRLEIKKDPRGGPYGLIDGKRVSQLAISISHDGDYAFAVATTAPGQITNDVLASWVSHNRDPGNALPSTPSL
jgi:phosphopantetheine--protein transferase-like protein